MYPDLKFEPGQHKVRKMISDTLKSKRPVMDGIMKSNTRPTSGLKAREVQAASDELFKTPYVKGRFPLASMKQ